MVLIIALTLFGAFAGSIPIMYASVLVGGCILPRVALPSAALWLLVLIPIGFMDSPRLLGQYLTPAVLMTGIWMARLIRDQAMAPQRGVRIRGWLLVGSFFILFLLSSLGSERLDLTAAWGGVVVVCVVAPTMLGQSTVDDVWPGVRSTLAAIGVFLGALAAADAFLQINPWTPLYQDLFQSYEWSVFRTKTSLGHPLTTATVASVALAVCLFPHGSRRRWPYLLCAVGAGIAVILTVSRTSVFAVGLAALVGAFAALSGGRSSSVERRRGRFIPILIAVALAGAVAWSPLLEERNQAAEGADSAAYRSSNFDYALDMLGEHPLLGVGPGTSPDIYWRDYNENLENSAFQLLLSMGLPAGILAFAGLAAIVMMAIKRGRPGAAAAIVAFVVSATGFNLLDINTAFLALMSPLILCGVGPTHTEDERTMNALDTILDLGPTTKAGQDAPAHDR